MTETGRRIAMQIMGPIYIAETEPGRIVHHVTVGAEGSLAAVRFLTGR